MKKFSLLYEELKFSDVFSAASKEEVETRKSQFYKIRLKEILDSVKKTKLPDGTWYVHEPLDLSETKLGNLKDLNVSIVDSWLDCFNCDLLSLEGAPKIVKGFADFAYNSLMNLKGAPEEVGGVFRCNNNQLTSLEGAPKEVGSFFCHNNHKKFRTSDVRDVCDVEGEIEI